MDTFLDDNRIYGTDSKGTKVVLAVPLKVDKKPTMDNIYRIIHFPSSNVRPVIPKNVGIGDMGLGIHVLVLLTVAVRKTLDICKVGLI